jgi:catechol 2,3-dioxygenase-like lactoylglutathione lyase family enzyme
MSTTTEKIVDRVAIVSVPVSDQDRAKDFYVNTLGFTLVADQPMGDGARWVQVAPGFNGVSLTLVTWFEQMPAGSLRGMVLQTKNIDAAHAELRKRGVKIDDIEDAPWGRYATFEDVDGNGFVLQQSAV